MAHHLIEIRMAASSLVHCILLLPRRNWEIVSLVLGAISPFDTTSILFRVSQNTCCDCVGTRIWRASDRCVELKEDWVTTAKKNMALPAITEWILFSSLGTGNCLPLRKMNLPREDMGRPRKKSPSCLPTCVGPLGGGSEAIFYVCLSSPSDRTDSLLLLRTILMPNEWALCVRCRRLVESCRLWH